MKNTERGTLILFATVGTGNYREVDYFIQENPEHICRTCYGPVATAELVGGIEEAVLLLTGEAENIHWDKLRSEFETRIIPVRKVAIPVGRTIDEMWQIVGLLNDSVPENSRVVIDITHAFRHLPVLMLASAAYLTVEKRVTIRGIYYGAYEARADHRSPIFDLGPFLTLTESYHALRQFRETGDARRLADNLAAINKDRWSRSEGSQDFSRLVNSLETLSATLVAALPLESGLHAARAHAALPGALAALQSTSGMAQSLIRALAPSLMRFAAEERVPDKASLVLTLPELRRQLEVIRFSVDSQAYDRALLLLREWVVSRCLLAAGKTAGWLDYNQARKPMESALNALVERARAGAAIVESQSELASLWSGIAGRRNHLAHAGMCPEEVKAAALAESVRELYEQCDRNCSEDTRWLTEREASYEHLLITPLGLSPGVLFTALSKAHPDRVVALTSAEGARFIPGICDRARYPMAQIQIEILDDPHRCFDRPQDLVKRIRPLALAAQAVTVNVTGGTTALEYLAERLGREAERLGVPVRRIALIDNRPYADQQAEPFVCGEMVVLE